MILTQTLDIAPSGLIDSGEVTYSIETDSGVASYKASVTISFLFFSKTFNYEGVAAVNAAMLLSSNFKLGMQIKQAGVSFKVTSIDAHHIAHCSARVVEPNVGEAGRVGLNIKSTYASIAWLSMTGTVLGYTANIIAMPRKT